MKLLRNTLIVVHAAEQDSQALSPGCTLMVKVVCRCSGHRHGHWQFHLLLGDGLAT